MGKRFRTCYLNQPFLLSPSFQDWQPEGHLARFIADVGRGGRDKGDSLRLTGFPTRKWESGRGLKTADVTFSDAEDHRACVGLLRQHLDPGQTRLLGWCWMSNHLHLVILALRAI